MADGRLLQIPLGFVRNNFLRLVRFLRNVVCRKTSCPKQFWVAVFVLSLVGLLGPMLMLSTFLAGGNKARDVRAPLVKNTVPGSLPLAYRANGTMPKGHNETCARFPQLFDLEFNNIYWQTLRTSNGTFQLFGAYLDDRESASRPTVRILGMIDRVEPAVVTYCQFWMGAQAKPVIVRSFRYLYSWFKAWGNYKNGIYQPYLIDCELPESYRNAVPESISLVEEACDNATNNLRVIYDKPAEKKGFAVCVKGLDLVHQDLSVRLVEWIELLGLLGADKVFFYELHVHPNISRVLDYYWKAGKVHVTPLTLAAGQPNDPDILHLYLRQKTGRKRQNEVVPYNDCFYKHMYEYRFIVLLDVDEVIVPRIARTWGELMDDILPRAWATKRKMPAACCVRNVYFFDEFPAARGSPRYMHMLQHVYRANTITRPGRHVKCFHNTENVLVLHNHYPLECLRNCSSYSVETFEARLHHYRANCASLSEAKCAKLKTDPVLDPVVRRFEQPLQERVSAVLEALGYF